MEGGEHHQGGWLTASVPLSAAPASEPGPRDVRLDTMDPAHSAALQLQQLPPTSSADPGSQGSFSYKARAFVFLFFVLEFCISLTRKSHNIHWLTEMSRVCMPIAGRYRQALHTRGRKYHQKKRNAHSNTEQYGRKKIFLKECSHTWKIYFFKKITYPITHRQPWFMLQHFLLPVFFPNYKSGIRLCRKFLCIDCFS